MYDGRPKKPPPWGGLRTAKPSFRLRSKTTGLGGVFRFPPSTLARQAGRGNGRERVQKKNEFGRTSAINSDVRQGAGSCVKKSRKTTHRAPKTIGRVRAGATPDEPPTGSPGPDWGPPFRRPGAGSEVKRPWILVSGRFGFGQNAHPATCPFSLLGAHSKAGREFWSKVTGGKLTCPAAPATGQKTAGRPGTGFRAYWAGARAGGPSLLPPRLVNRAGTACGDRQKASARQRGRTIARQTPKTPPSSRDLSGARAKGSGAEPGPLG